MLRILSRLLLAWVFVRGPLDVLRRPEPRAKAGAWLFDTMQDVAPLAPEDRLRVVRFNAAAQIAAAALLAIGKLPRLAALTLVASLVPTTLAGHPFWRIQDPAQRMQQEIHFNKNLAMLGGLLMVALEATRDRRRRG